jgi:hypothetical protein
MRTCVFLMLLALLCGASSAYGGAGDWPQVNGNAANTSFNGNETLITAATAPNLSLVWQEPRYGGPPYPQAPNAMGAAVVGDTLYAAWDDGLVEARALADGTQRWHVSLAGGTCGVDIGTLTPIAVSGRRVLVSCADTLYGLAANDGHVVWSLTRSGLSAGAAGISKGLAQVSFSDRAETSTAPGLHLAVDVRTGAVRWEVSVPHSVYGFYDPPGIAGGLVVDCTENRGLAGPGQLTARAVDTGDVVWQVTPGHCTDVSISRGAVYTGWMTSFDLATGAPLLTFTPDPVPLIPGPSSTPAIGGRELYFQNSYNVTPFTAAFSQKTGAQRWDVRCCGNESAASAASVAGGVAWVLGDNGILNGLDVANGTRIYSQYVRPEGFIRGGTIGPIVSHGYLVLNAFGLQVFSVPAP